MVIKNVFGSMLEIALFAMFRNVSDIKSLKMVAFNDVNRLFCRLSIFKTLSEEKVPNRSSVNLLLFSSIAWTYPPNPRNASVSSEVIPRVESVNSTMRRP